MLAGYGLPSLVLALVCLCVFVGGEVKNTKRMTLIWFGGKGEVWRERGVKCQRASFNAVTPKIVPT